MPLWSGAGRASLAKDLQKAEDKYNGLRINQERLTKEVERTSILANLSASDVSTLQNDLISAEMSNEQDSVSFYRDELRKERATLADLKRQLRNAKVRSLRADSDTYAQHFLVCSLQTQLDEYPSGPSARRQALRRRTNMDKEVSTQSEHNQPDSSSDSQQELVNWWIGEVNVCFTDYAQITRFPLPPTVVQCSDASCQNDPLLALGICKCNVEACFRRVQGFRAIRERLRWHPDRFYACARETRDSFIATAWEMFLIIDDMDE